MSIIKRLREGRKRTFAIKGTAVRVSFAKGGLEPTRLLRCNLFDDRPKSWLLAKSCRQPAASW